MREIEFRGKNDAGEWLYGYLTKPAGNPCFIIDGDDYFGGVIEETIGQYTGLTDENGTKVFEGDIVKLNNQIGSIVYEAGSFGIGIKEYIDYESLSKLSRSKTSNYYDGIGCDNFISLLEIYWNFNCNDCLLDEVVVIGNIHDNPELLQGEEV